MIGSENMRKSIQVTQSSMPSLEEYLEEIKDLWISKWLTNNGTKHQQLEEALRTYMDTDNLALYTNGHLALENILTALKLSGEVITTPFTFASTIHAIVRAGLTPVFCDINSEDYTLQIEQLENLITERTCAIVPVHVYGNVCNVNEIDRIAKKYSLKVIYDAAHAFSVKVDGVNVANFGDASMFSFHATKVFNTIEGGAVTFKDAALKTVLDALKNFGITGPEHIEYVGGNAKMNEFQAAMGLCNLRSVDQEIDKRKKVFERYTEQLQNIKGLKLPKIQTGVESNYAYYPVVFENNREGIYKTLREQGIFARKYFYPLMNNHYCSEGGSPSEVTPIAQSIAERVLCLPLYADLDLQDVDRIITIIKSEIGVLLS